MTGKEKCEFLKGIRKRMAEANGIPYEPRECSNEGDCPGTCPLCEQEARELLAQIRLKESKGDSIRVHEEAIEMLKYSTDDAEYTDEEKEPMRLRVEEVLRRLNEPLRGVVRMDIDEDLKCLKEDEERMRRHNDFVGRFFGDSYLGGDVNPLDEEWHKLLEVLRRTEEKEPDERTKEDNKPFTINPFKS